MSRGWISLDRRIQDNWLWKEKPFSKAQAWIDLLLMANHEDKKFPFGDEVVEVSRGSLITSEVKLMERWGWGKTKVRTFLKLLESDSMIVREPNRKRTALNIVNYSVYQESQTKSKPPMIQTEPKTVPQNVPKTNHKQTAPNAVNKGICEESETINIPKKYHRQTVAKPLPNTNNNVNNVNKENMPPPAESEKQKPEPSDLPEGAIIEPDGTVSYAEIDMWGDEPNV